MGHRGNAGFGFAAEFADYVVAHRVEVGDAFGHVSAQLPQHFGVVRGRGGYGLGGAQTCGGFFHAGFDEAAVPGQLGRHLQDFSELTGFFLGLLIESLGHALEGFADAFGVGGAGRGFVGVGAKRWCDEISRTEPGPRTNPYSQNSRLRVDCCGPAHLHSFV